MIGDAMATKAIGINRRGTIVGFYCLVISACPRSANGNKNARGFLLSEGKFTMIDVPGAVGTSAYAINARGDIVGPYMPDASHTLGFLRTRRERRLSPPLVQLISRNTAGLSPTSSRMRLASAMPTAARIAIP
jgi:uncharacterized membrane protein